MQINSVSNIGFRANIAKKAADVANNVAKRTEDVITSCGEDCFMAKNINGENVKITCLLDAVKALGIKISDAPSVISQSKSNFIVTPFGKITCMEDAVNLAKKV